MSIIGAILFWISIWESILWMVTGLPNSLRIIILWRLYKWVRHNMPDTWSYDISFLTTNNKKCFCVAEKKIPIGSDYVNKTNAYIYHYYGKVLRTDLLDNIKVWDPEFDETQFSRDLKINEILND